MTTFFRIVLCSTFFLSMYGADTQFNFDCFQDLPSDLQKKICALVFDAHANSYPVTQEQKEEYLILPTTTPIHPIRSISSREDLNKDLSVKPNEVCVPYAQCWVKKTFDDSMMTNYQPKFRVRLDNDIKKAQAIYYLPPQDQGKSFFDGVNAKGFGFYALQTPTGMSHCVFLNEKAQSYSDRFSVYMQWDFTCNRTLRSSTLQHDMNRVFISTDRLDGSHILTIYERDKDRAIDISDKFNSNRGKF